MAIVFYISLLVSPPFLLILLAKREGDKRPSIWRVFCSIVTAIPLALLVPLLTTTFSYEGQGSLIFVFHGLSIAVILSYLSGKKLWRMLFVLSVFTVLLYNFHMFLAFSPQYTDGAEGRNKRIKFFNMRAKRNGKPLTPAVVTYPEWHTWLTRLYAVREKK